MNETGVITMDAAGDSTQPDPRAESQEPTQPGMQPADRDREMLSGSTHRNLTPSTADNNSFETGAGEGSAGFDSPATGSLNLDNPEVDLGDDPEEADLDSRS